MMTVASLSQTRKPPLKPSPKIPAVVPIAAPSPAAGIPESEWVEIAKSFDAEDWNQTVSLSTAALNKYKTDNKEKQLAQLRYFYLFALAGKVSKGQMTFEQLKTLSEPLIGQTFSMPSRKVLADCKNALNYICAMKEYYRTWRVTATNKSFTTIHSFEYIQLPEKVDTVLNADKNVALDGKLIKIEFNPKKQTTWIMRLYFTALITAPR
jgi:hypothetical protein